MYMYLNVRFYLYKNDWEKFECWDILEIGCVYRNVSYNCYWYFVIKNKE